MPIQHGWRQSKSQQQRNICSEMQWTFSRDKVIQRVGRESNKNAQCLLYICASKTSSLKNLWTSLKSPNFFEVFCCSGAAFVCRIDIAGVPAPCKRLGSFTTGVCVDMWSRSMCKDQNQHPPIRLPSFPKQTSETTDQATVGIARCSILSVSKSYVIASALSTIPE